MEMKYVLFSMDKEKSTKMTKNKFDINFGIHSCEYILESNIQLGDY